MNVLIIVPTYNERENLRVLLDDILAHYDYRMLVVDDQPPDETGAVADQYAHRHPDRIEVMRRTGPRGLGCSYIDGDAVAPGLARNLAGGLRRLQFVTRLHVVVMVETSSPGLPHDTIGTFTEPIARCVASKEHVVFADGDA
jgi:glycosyltransferase involved in cell wall biosynthesis